MKLTVRARLLGLVGAAVGGFLITLLTRGVVAHQVEGRLKSIQAYYVPRVELGPQLDSKFQQVQRGLQDAVAARDLDMLAATGAQKQGLLDALAAAGDAVSPSDAAELRAALEDYYAAAYDVSRRLIAEEGGESLVLLMAQMQAKQGAVTKLIRKTVAFDKAALAEAFAAAAAAQSTVGQVGLIASGTCLAALILLTLTLGRSILRSLADLSAGFTRFGKSDFQHPIAVLGEDELAEVARQANRMADSLQKLSAERDQADWLRDGAAGLSNELRGVLEPREVAERATRYLARHLDAAAAALYGVDPDDEARLLGDYALGAPSGAKATRSFRKGEGLVGQALVKDELTILSNPPEDYLRIRSGLGESAAKCIVLMPLTRGGTIIGVLELALLGPFRELSSELLLSIREILAIAMEGARARSEMRILLGETKRQSAQLTEQQVELRQSNDELTHLANELEAQRRSLELKNTELGQAQQGLEQKAQELATVSAYKSQFLANMSHELRTPLNSMLLLSNLLAENEAQNLTAKQVEFAKTIHGAGSDLLALINQVLDLAKVEAGKQELHLEPVRLQDLAQRAQRIFEPLAKEKGLQFKVELEPGLPDTLTTDRQRLDQILRNLLGNAIKFTDRGEVTLRMGKPSQAARLLPALAPERTLAFAVIDTGPGIAREHQERVFSPFEQVEGSSIRRHGGTGLGLTISREMAVLLGGELVLHSELGKGSTFCCYLPLTHPQAGRPAAPRAERERAPVLNGQGLLLVMEDDATFAEALRGIIQSQGLRCMVAPDGRTGLQLARSHKPSGIILDVRLPDIDGWKVMEQLRADAQTADIPVHFVSAIEAPERGMALGAVGYLTKPASHRDLLQVVEALAPPATERFQEEVRLFAQTLKESPQEPKPAAPAAPPGQDLKGRSVLVVDDDMRSVYALSAMLRAKGAEVFAADTGATALGMLDAHPDVQAVLMDIMMPEMDGYEAMRRIRSDRRFLALPIIALTAKAMKGDPDRCLEAGATDYLPKPIQPERLMAVLHSHLSRGP